MVALNSYSTGKTKLKTDKTGTPVPVQSVGIASDAKKTPLVSTTAENYARKVVPNNPLTGAPQFTGKPGEYAYSQNRDLLAQQEYQKIAASSPKPTGTQLSETMVKPTNPIPTAPIVTPPPQPLPEQQVANAFTPQLGAPNNTMPTSGVNPPYYEQPTGPLGLGKTGPLYQGQELAQPTELTPAAGVLGGGELTQVGYSAIKDIAAQVAKETYAKFTKEMTEEGVKTLSSNALSQEGVEGAVGILTKEQATQRAINNNLVNEAAERLKGNFIQKIISDVAGSRKWIVGGLIASTIGGYGVGISMAFNKTGDAVTTINMMIGQAEKTGDKAKILELKQYLRDVTSVKEILKNFIPGWGYYRKEYAAWEKTIDYADQTIASMDKKEAAGPTSPEYYELQKQLLSEQLKKAQRENVQAEAPKKGGGGLVL